nr:GntR family transcriptional regulator [Streptomyces sp. ATCC 21386]
MEHRTRPLWRQIAAEIIRRIEGGTYSPGSRVPSTLEIAQEFGVVNATAAKAMRHVREQDWTRGEVPHTPQATHAPHPPRTTIPPPQTSDRHRRCNLRR